MTTYNSIGATAIKPNYQQAIQILGIPTLKGKERIEQITAYGKKLLDLVNTQLAAVTLDAEGAIIFERDNPPYLIPSNPTRNSQATGTGDTFVSGLTLALASGVEMKLAAAIASATAAISVKSLLKEIGINLKQPWIVIHPGATAISRCYPPESFAIAARKLVKDYNIQIIFTGTEPEKDLVNLQHTPWEVPNRVIFHDVPCRICYKSICPEGHYHCLRLVEPERVVNAALELLQKSQRLLIK